MYLKNIYLSNFKSYDDANFSFDENVNAIVGNNGSGKTNLLDAIYYLSFCKSYFSAHDMHSVRFDTDYFAVHGEFFNDDAESSTQISCTYKLNDRKVMKANRKEYSRLSDHIGLFPVVMVSPYDSDIINEGSEVRRKFFDMFISQFDKEYLQQLISYRKLLMQRNVLLKQFLDNQQFDSSLLQIIDEQMMPMGDFIFSCRQNFIQNILPVFQNHYQRLSNNQETVDIQYQSGLTECSYEEGLKRAAQADAKSGFTTFGIHKDDFQFFINGQPVKRFGSQGQQKSFSLALKLSQFDYFYDNKKIKPILLLDDIFDKLDNTRMAELLNLVGKEHFGQVFITDTDGERVQRILNDHSIQHNIIEIHR